MADVSRKIAVVGGGLVGLVAGLTVSEAAGASNSEVILVAPEPTKPDKRTTAMLMPSVELLRRLGAWGALETVSAALRTMRIVDASGRLVTGPPVDFRSSEIGEEAFGYNVPNDAAAELLRGALTARPDVTIIDAHAVSFEQSAKAITMDNGNTIQADLFIAADGRDSLLRSEAGIGTRRWSYHQRAIVTTFSHTLPHGGVSTELHTRTGPFTQVPLPAHETAKYRSSLVWVVSPGDAEHLLKQDHDWLSQEIESKLQSSLGKVTLETGLQAFPLSGMAAKQFAAVNVVLVGEAAHVVPPIGAQGFNLGVNDIITLTELLKGEASVEQICTLYNRKRHAEVLAKTGGIDLLNRSLLTGFLPLHIGRSLVLGALSGSVMLRKLLMTGIMNGPAGLFSQRKDRRVLPAAER